MTEDLPPTYPFVLPPLPFAYDALEPHIDTATMRLHHGKHHQAYVDNLNSTLKNQPALHGLSVEEILRKFDEIPPDIQRAVRNHAGGHANHQFFWKIIRPPGVEGAGGGPQGALAEGIHAEWGSIDGFKRAFSEAAAKVFGSGWAFLGAEPKTLGLKIVTTPNQDSDLLWPGQAGLIACDVWEHAHYLRYQNRRPEYLAAWWNVVAWDIVGRRFDGIKAGRAHL